MKFRNLLDSLLRGETGGSRVCATGPSITEDHIEEGPYLELHVSLEPY